MKRNSVAPYILAAIVAFVLVVACNGRAGAAPTDPASSPPAVAAQDMGPGVPFNLDPSLGPVRQVAPGRQFLCNSPTGCVAFTPESLMAHMVEFAREVADTAVALHEAQLRARDAPGCMREATK